MQSIKNNQETFKDLFQRSSEVGWVPHLKSRKLRHCGNGEGIDKHERNKLDGSETDLYINGHLI